MKLIINKEEYNIDLTAHETKHNEQCEIFLSEHEEFKEALFVGIKECVIQECIDCIKALSKALEYTNEDQYKTVTVYSIQASFQEIKTNVMYFRDLGYDMSHGYIALNVYISFLFAYCERYNFNIREQLQINNNKTNSRGTKPKHYFLENEIEMLKQVSTFCKENGKEGFGDDINKILKELEG